MITKIVLDFSSMLCLLCPFSPKSGFLPGIFSGGKSIVMQISFVMLLFSDQISGGAKSPREKLPQGGAPLPPSVEQSQKWTQEILSMLPLATCHLPLDPCPVMVCTFQESFPDWEFSNWFDLNNNSLCKETFEKQKQHLLLTCLKACLKAGRFRLDLENN